MPISTRSARPIALSLSWTLGELGPITDEMS